MRTESVSVMGMMKIAISWGFVMSYIRIRTEVIHHVVGQCSLSFGGKKAVLTKNIIKDYYKIASYIRCIDYQK